jgi:hypothetical protein
MWAAVVFFAFTAAQDPVRIGIIVLLISRPRPLPNVFAYWLGLMTTGFGAALAALFLLRDFLLPVARVVTSAAASPVVPPIQIVLGVLALSTAAMLAAPSSVRQAAHALVPGGDSSALVVQQKTPSAFATICARLSWTGLLEGRSLGMALVAGLCTSTQLVEFWGAMMVILASGKGAAAQVGAALMFTLLAFTIIEIPLVSCLIAPAKTQAIVMQLHDRLRTHRRPILAFMLGAMGVLMVTSGVGGV